MHKDANHGLQYEILSYATRNQTKGKEHGIPGGNLLCECSASSIRSNEIEGLVGGEMLQ